MGTTNQLSLFEQNDGIELDATLVNAIGRSEVTNFIRCCKHDNKSMCMAFLGRRGVSDEEARRIVNAASI